MIRAFRDYTGGLSTTFWWLWGGTLLNKLGAFVVPFLTLYLTTARGVPIATAGMIVSLYGVGSFSAGFVGGVLADRVGRKPTLLFALFSASASMLALGFAQRLPVIAVATLCVGFFSELIRPAVNATIADVIAPERRAKAYSLLYWAANMGFALAPVIAGEMAQRSYLLLFVLDAATTFAYGIVVWRRIPETRPQEAVHARHSVFAGLAAPLTDAAFLPFGFLVLLLAMVFHQFHSALPFDMVAQGIAPATYGKIISINGWLIVLLQPFAAKLFAGHRRGNLAAVASVLTGVGFVLPAFLPVTSVYALGIVVWTLGEILHAPIPPAVVADLAPAALRGSYQGALQVVWGLSFTLAPAIGSLVLQHAGARALWAGCLGVSLFVAAGHLVIAGSRRRRIAQLRTERPAGHVSLVED